MMLEFEIIKDSMGNKHLLIFERGNYEKPLVLIRRHDIERLKEELFKEG